MWEQDWQQLGIAPTTDSSAKIRSFFFSASSSRNGDGSGIQSVTNFPTRAITLASAVTTRPAESLIRTVSPTAPSGPPIAINS